MTRTIVAALAGAALLGGSAVAQTTGTTTGTQQQGAGQQNQPVTAQPVAPGEPVLIYDEALSERFSVKREIVDRVQQEFGETAAYESGQELPPHVNQEIVPGQMMPEEAPVEAVPAGLGDLPTLGEGTEWVKSGNHLVEVDDDGMIVMVVYDALP